MAFEVIDGFNQSENAPLDKVRTTVNSEAEMLAIKWVYDGLVITRNDYNPKKLFLCKVPTATQGSSPWTVIADWEEFSSGFADAPDTNNYFRKLGAWVSAIHSNLTDVFTAALGISEGHVDSSKPLAIPAGLTDAEILAWTNPVEGLEAQPSDALYKYIYTDGAWQKNVVGESIDKYPATTTPTTLAFLEDNDNWSPSFDEVVTTIPASVIAEFLPGQKIKGTNYIYEAWNTKIYRTQLTQVINAPAMVSGTNTSATETETISIADNVQQINVSVGLKGALAYDVQYMDIEVPSKAWTAYRGRITLLFGDNLSVGASTLVRLIDPQTSLEIVLPTPFVSGETVVLSSNGEKYFIL